MRRIKSIISLVLALILACAAALPISAAGPLAGDSLYINTHIDAINSATGKNYLSDTGDTMDFLKLKAYDQNPVYCIEKGARFTRTLYKAQTLANSAYWKKLTEKAREGIALAAAFGYPAQSYSALGVPSADDAYTATQFIIWEYQQGLRTAPDEQIADRRYRAKIAGTPAETAYKTILANIRKYISDPQYSGNTQNLYGFVQLTSGSTSKEQEIICFYGDTPKLIEKGYIEIYKKDTDGNLLDGAEFSVYNSSGAYVTKIGPTANGYARSAEITLGTYTVVETKFPQNYRKYDKDTWTVTLNSGSAKFTINAVNEIVPGACRIIEENISVIKTVICSRIIIDKNIFGMEYDDLYQEGCLLLCNAALMYDESRGSSFWSFAYVVILNGLISYCKKVENNRKNRAEYIESLKRQPESFSLQNSTPYERMVETNIIDFLDNIKAQYSGTVRLGIEALSLKVKGLSGGEIARLYGVKTNLVGAWISRALKKLKQNSVFNSYMDDFNERKVS